MSEVIEGKGQFKVKTKPYDEKDFNSSKLQKLKLNKEYEGDLQGMSSGEMLSYLTPKEGSAGYIAIVHFEGSLKGRPGSFVLQHYGIMDSGEDRLIVEIIPDSATGELRGLLGTIEIEVKDGNHYYEFEINQ